VKGGKFMDIKNATIERNETNVTLKLTLGDEVLDIVLTEDKPNDVKNVFNKLLEQLKSGVFEFNLTDEKEDLFFHLCKEYITQLNTELKSTYKELEDNGLINTGS
jgi:hypothetical protein